MAQEIDSCSPRIEGQAKYSFSCRGTSGAEAHRMGASYCRPEGLLHPPALSAGRAGKVSCKPRSWLARRAIRRPMSDVQGPKSDVRKTKTGLVGPVSVASS